MPNTKGNKYIMAHLFYARQWASPQCHNLKPPLAFSFPTESTSNRGKKCQMLAFSMTRSELMENEGKSSGGYQEKSSAPIK